MKLFGFIEEDTKPAGGKDPLSAAVEGVTNLIPDGQGSVTASTEKADTPPPPPPKPVPRAEMPAERPANEDNHINSPADNTPSITNTNFWEQDARSSSPGKSASETAVPITISRPTMPELNTALQGEPAAEEPAVEAETPEEKAEAVEPIRVDDLFTPNSEPEEPKSVVEEISTSPAAEAPQPAEEEPKQFSVEKTEVVAEEKSSHSEQPSADKPELKVVSVVHELKAALEQDIASEEKEITDLKAQEARVKAEQEDINEELSAIQQKIQAREAHLTHLRVVVQKQAETLEKELTASQASVEKDGTAKDIEGGKGLDRLAA